MDGHKGRKRVPPVRSHDYILSVSRPEDSMCEESLGDDPEIELDYEASVISENDVGSVPEGKSKCEDVEKLLEGRTTRKPTTPSMPGPRKSMYVDNVVESDDGERKRKVETGKGVEGVEIHVLPSIATAPCMT